MNRNCLLRYAAGITGIILFFLAGCASTQPTRFYALNAIVPPGDYRKPVSENTDAVGIRLVSIPDYLDRPHIMSRTSQNQLKLSDFEKWAGSLKQDISRVLAENLSFLLSTDHIYMYPWKQAVPVAYLVEVDITRFDGMLGGSVSLKAQWTISGNDGRQLLATNRSDFSEQVDERSYEALVAAESRLLAKLSGEIADAIKSVSP